MAVTWSTTDKSAAITLSAGNLTATCGANAVSSVRSSAAVTGKIYFELLTGGSVNDPDYSIAISNSTQGLGSLFGGSNSICWAASGDVWFNNAIVTTINSYNPTTGVRLRVAVDIPNKLIWFAPDTGNWNNSGTANPATGVGGISFSAITGSLFVAWQTKNSGNVGNAKFKTADFTYSAPSGFSAVDPAASYTLSIATASVAVSAQPVGLRAARRLPVAQATVTATTRPVGLLARRRLAVAQAAVVAATQPIGLRAGRRLAVAQAAVAVSAQPVGLLARRRLGVSQAAAAVATQPVGLLARRRLAVSPASFSITTQPVGFGRSYSFVIDPTTVTITANPIFLKTAGGQILSIAPAAVVVDPKPVGLLARRVLKIDTAAVEITTSTITITPSVTGEKIIFDAATIEISFGDVTLRKGLPHHPPPVVDTPQEGDMNTSGQVGTIRYTLQELLDAGFRRCKLEPQAVSAEMMHNGRNVLQQMLSALPAIITPLWAKEHLLLPVPVGSRKLVLPVGTVDVVKANLRTYQRFPTPLNDLGTELQFDMGSLNSVTALGIRTSVSGSFTVKVEASSDAADWDTVIPAKTQQWTADEMVWFELDPIAVARHLRITGLLGYQIRTLFAGGEATDREIVRFNHDDYTLQTPTRQGPPNQYWLDRQETPEMRFDRIPDQSMRNVAISLWRQRQIEDVGDFMQEVEIPQRWYRAVIAALAYDLALDTPKVDPSVLAILKGPADEAMNAMANEERDSSPIRIIANLRGYTR